LHRVTVFKNALIAAISILLVTIQSYTTQEGIVKMVFAKSPSFVRQEIIDDSRDWIFWKGSSSNKINLTTHDGNIREVDRADDSSECGIDEDFIPPNIQSVSYVSDGKNLTATVWLTSQFEEPPLTYTIDTFQEELMVRISNTSLNLENYTAQHMARLLSPEINLEKNSSSMLAGKPAHEISYTNRISQDGVKVTRIWTVDGGKAYEIAYSVLPNNRYVPIIQEMIDTFEIVSSSSSSSFSPSVETSLNRSNSNISKDFLPYKTSEIRILYPPEWHDPDQTNSNDEARTVIFRSPFEDSKSDISDIPSWREITFTMAIDIDSVLDAGTDYRVIYSSSGQYMDWILDKAS
jgi:hypothetical protein